MNNETKAKPTPGDCRVRIFKDSIRIVSRINPFDGVFICTIDTPLPPPTLSEDTYDKGKIGAEMAANANLIAEAFNVHHETGLTPRELVERYEEAIKSLKECLEGIMELNGEYQEGWDDVIERAKQEIKKTNE